MPSISSADEHLLLCGAHRRERGTELAGRRFGKRVVLGDHVRSVIPVAVAEHDRLSEEAVGADRPGGREEVGGPGGAEVVRTLHHPPHLPGAQCGELVHHRIGSHVAHGAEQVLAVHHVGHHSLGAGAAQPLSVGLTAGDADDLVASGDELAGERCTDGARGAGEQHSHGFIPCLQSHLHGSARAETTSIVARSPEFRDQRLR